MYIDVGAVMVFRYIVVCCVAVGGILLFRYPCLLVLVMWCAMMAFRYPFAFV